MSDFWDTAEESVYNSRIKIPYSWQAGETASYFFTQLRDEKKLWGKKCPRCQKVLMPPRKNCPFCFEITGDWVEVKDEGTVETYTVVRRDTNIQPLQAPFAYAVIKLDGADTGLTHLLSEVDPQTVKEGMRVKAVFADERQAEAGRVKSPRLNLEPMFQLALDPKHIDEGETRLVARVDEVLAGETITPAASQVRGATLVVAHLHYALPPPPQKDKNTRRDYKATDNSNENEPLEL